MTTNGRETMTDTNLNEAAPDLLEELDLIQRILDHGWSDEETVERLRDRRATQKRCDLIEKARGEA